LQHRPQVAYRHETLTDELTNIFRSLENMKLEEERKLQN
jgi:hypothetical protein